jgi:hypothetical protein
VIEHETRLEVTRATRLAWLPGEAGDVTLTRRTRVEADGPATDAGAMAASARPAVSRHNKLLISLLGSWPPVP